MAQDAREAPAGRGRSSAPPSTGMMWESPPSQMPTHAPFPSSSPYTGAFVGGAVTAGGAQLSPAAADSSHLPSEHVHGHAWNQSAHSVAAHGGSGYRENFLSLLGATTNVAPEIFQDVPAACDYLAGPVGATAAAAAGNTAGGAAAYGLGSVDRVAHGSSVGCAPRYDHEVKPADCSLQQGFGAPTASSFLQQMIPTRVEIQTALGYPGMGSGRPTESSSFGVGSLPDAGSFGGYRPAAEFMSTNSSTQEQDIRPGMGSSSSGSGAARVATRRRSEERGGGNAKKSKQEASRKASPPKAQAPKVKLGEKITALQQIVSPFGKTDTSSVLFETIGYIKFLHEQLRVSARAACHMFVSHNFQRCMAKF
ncbi:hypothetical protein PVAP13_7KG295800 [Panicum virgatum]|uniref:BHLH domain-containing protein n=1 Tax=Panicum virgatum TaxID=38727 RepID=A0A8T0QIP3_PANVG|nr:hypothetical protein PVAP13_7KG295800 [Panicum virgatum]